jgi:3-hydroxyacyl-CoA dehydrogenase
MYDQVPEALDKAETFIADSMAVLVEAGHLTVAEVEAAKARIHKAASLEEVLADVGFVQESAFESYEVKRPLFRQLDVLCPPEVILATSSSGLLMSEIQRGLTHPERCLVAHPFNPPHLIPLVELVPGGETVPQTIDLAADFYRSVGKVPIKLKKEVTGFIVNRLQAALWREAIDLVVQGVASVEDVDLAVSAGPGLRWALFGQHTIFHLNGGPGGLESFLRQFHDPVETWWDALATWTEWPPTAEQMLIDGLAEAHKDRTYQELQDYRDENLLKLLDLLHKK